MKGFKHRQCILARRAYENEIAKHECERTRHFIREEKCNCDYCSIECYPDYSDNVKWIAFYMMERAAIFEDMNIPFGWFEVI